MVTISKQLTCQKYILKINSSRLRREKWNLNISLDEARNNDEIISLADSQMLRWIDELNGVMDADRKAKSIKKQIRELRKCEPSLQIRREIRRLYSDLDALQFKPDYLCLIIDKGKDYLRAVKGFKVNGIKYKRLLGTTGGIKNSTIVFVSERLSDELHRRINNGRDMTKAMVPAKLNAYMALTCSASVPVSLPKGILVVDDVETEFLSEIIYLSSQDEGEPIMEYKKDYLMKLDATDGFGLMLPSLAQKWSEEIGLDYTASGMCCRYSFTKGMVFTFDFLDFADKVAGGKYFVKDVWGNEVDIRNVELILTTSMLKLWDSYPSCEEFIRLSEENHYTFAITKACPEILEDERCLNYQFIQPFNLDEDDIQELISPTLNEIWDVLQGDWRRALVFLRGVGMTEENIGRSADDIAKAIMADQRVFDDPYVQNSIYQLIRNRINDAKIGVLKVHANYSIASGDPYILCQSIFGLEKTGLLKSGEIYNRYWADNDAEDVVCFRAPMSCHENIRKMKPCRSEEARYWYQYMKTCTVVNAWDETMPSLNGMDFDGDLVFITDNEVLVRKHEKLPAIVCVQKKAEKTVALEEDFVTSDINAFGNDIGSITNRTTSMYEVRYNFEKGSREYEELTYRIRCGQLLQQDAIDKAKGIISKPAPREWYDRHAVAKIEDEDKRNFYRTIIADKKPMFMTYIYPTLANEYKTYLTSTNKNSLREFGVTVEELKEKRYDELTLRQIEFLHYYDKMMPVGLNDCVMNRICRIFEREFDDFIKNKSGTNAEFDPEILKSGIAYTDKDYKAVRNLHNDYLNRLKNYKTRACYERVDGDEFNEQLDRIKAEFEEECDKVCPCRRILTDILIDICYSNASTKRYIWSSCGNIVVDNLLKNNDNTLRFPELCAEGEFEYGGKRFTIKEKKVEGEENDSAE